MDNKKLLIKRVLRHIAIYTTLSRICKELRSSDMAIDVYKVIIININIIHIIHINYIN